MVLAIIVITLISAVLFPRGFVLFDQSKKATLQTTLVSFSSAVNFIHQKWLLNKTPQIDFMVSEDKHRTIVVNEQGWPVAVLDETKDAPLVNLQCQGLWQTLLGNAQNILPEQKKDSFFRISSKEGFCLYHYTGLNELNTIVYETHTGQVYLK